MSAEPFGKVLGIQAFSRIVQQHDGRRLVKGKLFQRRFRFAQLGYFNGCVTAYAFHVVVDDDPNFRPASLAKHYELQTHFLLGRQETASPGKRWGSPGLRRDTLSWPRLSG